MSTETVATTSSRHQRLDGLRGLLSVLVALNHSFLVLAVPYYANIWGQNILKFHDLQSKINQLLNLLGNGGAMVTLFFVMSGLVIAKSLEKTELNLYNYVIFTVRRVLRLYPPYAAMIFGVAIVMKLGLQYQTYPFASTWFHWWMNFTMTFGELLKNLIFYHIYVGGVTWTLRVIIFISLFLPFLAALSKKTSKWLDIGIILLMVVASFNLLNWPNFRDPRYLFMFYAGLSLPKWRTFFAAIPNTLLVKVSLLLSILAFLYVRFLTDEYLGGVIETFFACLYIGILAYNHDIKLFDFLNNSLWQYLGKISYSIYLVHFSVLYLFSKLVFWLFPNFSYPQNYLFFHLLIFVLSLGFTIPLSHILYLYVEKPFGKVSDKMKQLNPQ